MKRKSIIIIFTMLLSVMCVCCLAACGGDSNSNKETYTVTLKIPSNGAYNSNFKIHQTIKIEEGELLGDLVTKPKGNGLLVFGGWYLEEGFATQWNIYSDPVQTNMTLYGKWIKKSLNL